MQAAQTNLVTQGHFARIPNHGGRMQITTTLYELLEAIQKEVPPGNRGDKLATAVVTHLLDAGRIRLIGDHHRANAS